jgi:kumamolisin
VTPPPAPPGSTTALTPRQVAQLYGYSGGAAGQAIGLIEFGGGYVDSNIEAFFSGENMTPPQVFAIGVDGASNSPGIDFDANLEVTLDIDVAGSVGLGAKIIVYFAPSTEQGWIDAVTTAIHDDADHLSALSISWVTLESDATMAWSAAGVDAISAAFAEAASLGVTVFVSSGDDGSACGKADGLARVYYPASDPWVTSCGGVTISNVSGTSFTQATWPDTGGGISTLFDVPGWQADAGVPASANGDGRRGRGVPDIAGNADPASGYYILLNGFPIATGGTSAVAPFYAGLVATLNNTPAGPIGYLNPRLYAWKGSAVFRDIADGVSNASGGAPGYTSGPGWDACTGLGSINGAALLHALKPCQRALEDLENISPGDFRTPAEYEHALAYLRQQLQNCVKRYGYPD